MTTQRLIAAAISVAHAIGHKDLSHVTPDAITAFKAEAAPEDADLVTAETVFKATATAEQLEKYKDGIREADAVNWLVKVQREVRGEVLAGKTPDLKAAATAAAEHLGCEVAPILALLSNEQSVFKREFDANRVAIKAGRVFYSLGTVIEPSALYGKSPEQIAQMLAEHAATPIDEFLPVKASAA